MVFNDADSNAEILAFNALMKISYELDRVYKNKLVT
jgi:hypothetical protein